VDSRAEHTGIRAVLNTRQSADGAGSGRPAASELKLILDHLGRPSGGTASQPDLWANLPEVVALARYPNVAMKATGAPSYSGHAYPFADIHDNLHRLYDAFGPTRFF
jgi:predicted TIM-barrel fold metal-dependent hydrolase